MTRFRSRGWRLLVAGAWALLGFLVLPALVALPVSLTPKRYLSLPDGSISFEHYADLLTSGDWLSSAAQSFVIALAAATLSTAAGTLCAISLWRTASRSSEMIRAFLLMPLIIPPIISAMAFYRAWVRLGLLDSYTGVILAHAILAAPVVLLTVSASLAHFDPRLEQASRSLGASLATTVRRVILPGIRPGVLAGAIFAFILSWDEVVVALFIARFRIFTLPRRMWDGIRENTDPAVAAAAVILIAITSLAMLFAVWFMRRGREESAG
jgi:putative spermidine/putrescine transport system permease protein